MLTPQELLEIVDTMYPLLDELNTWIVDDLIKRLMARMARGEDLSFGATDTWQLELYQAAGGHYEELTQKIGEWTKKSDAEVKAIFEDAGLRAWNADDAFYVAKGFESISLLKSEALMRILLDTYQRTNGEIHNFTRTTAEHSEQHFMNVCDKAHLKVITGAQSYTGAVMEAVNELIETQAKVKYPTGHVDTIETAVLRCVRTGTAQASGNLSIQGMVEHGWDIIRVSAHLGARYGDSGENPSNHFWWQGKLYSREGKTPGLPDFVTCTGYGTGAGLCGWNCRHSFGPGDPEHNPYQEYDAEENKRAYDLSQRQRAQERAIRKSKASLMGYDTAIKNCADSETRKALQDAYDRTAQRLSRQNKDYSAFCKENGLARYDDRLRVAKWNRTEATQAAKAAARADKENLGDISKEEARERFRNAAKNVNTQRRIDKQKSEDIINSIADKLGVDSGQIDIGNLPVASQEATLKAVRKVVNQFPKLRGHTKIIAADPDLPSAARSESLIGKILLGPKFKDFQALEKWYDYQVKLGFFAKGTSAHSIVVHEMGHQLDGLFTLNRLAGASINMSGVTRTSLAVQQEVLQRIGFYDRMKELRIEHKARGLSGADLKHAMDFEKREFMTKHISEYAARNEREFFAECFSEYMTSEEPRDAAKIFGEIIERLYGELK